MKHCCRNTPPLHVKVGMGGIDAPQPIDRIRIVLAGKCQSDTPRDPGACRGTESDPGFDCTERPCRAIGVAACQALEPMRKYLLHSRRVTP